jgi:hypothetical protein
MSTYLYQTTTTTTTTTTTITITITTTEETEILIILQKLRKEDNLTTETLTDTKETTTKKDVDLNLEENSIVILKPKPVENIMKKDPEEVNLTLEMLMPFYQLLMLMPKTKNTSLLFLNQPPLMLLL